MNPPQIGLLTTVSQHMQAMMIGGISPLFRCGRTVRKTPLISHRGWLKVLSEIEWPVASPGYDLLIAWGAKLTNIKLRRTLEEQLVRFETEE